MTRGDELKPGDVIRFARTWHTITDLGRPVHCAPGVTLHLVDDQGHTSAIETTADSWWEVKP